MTLLAITAEEVALNGKAWVEAITAIIEAIIVKVGVLGLAAIAVSQNMLKQLPQEFKERLDRYNDRLDRVAIATVAAAPEEKKTEVALAVARTPVSGESELLESSRTPTPVIVASPEPISVTEAPPEKEEKPKP